MKNKDPPLIHILYELYYYFIFIIKKQTNMKQSVFDLDVSKIGNMLHQLIVLNKEIITKFEQEEKRADVTTVKILSIDELIKILNICLNTAYGYIRDGILPRRKIGARHY